MACSSFASHSGRRHDGSLTDSRPTTRIILLTTFRKQRNNERAEIARARKIADECARLNP
jgi:hypothetical protein